MHTTATNDWPAFLKSIRDSLDLTQERAAEQVGVSARSWVAWENGYRTPTPSAQILIRQLASRIRPASATGT
jgi:DNA-binding XRE family transcriptional regulator